MRIRIAVAAVLAACATATTAADRSFEKTIPLPKNNDMDIVEAPRARIRAELSFKD